MLISTNNARSDLRSTGWSHTTLRERVPLSLTRSFPSLSHTHTHTHTQHTTHKHTHITYITHIMPRGNKMGATTKTAVSGLSPDQTQRFGTVGAAGGAGGEDELKLWPKLPTYSEQHTLKLIARGLLPLSALAEVRAKLEEQMRKGAKNLRESFVLLEVGLCVCVCVCVCCLLCVCV